MGGNRVPDQTHGFKPFAAPTAYKGVKCPSGTFGADPPSRGVRVRHVHLAVLVAARIQALGLSWTHLDDASLWGAA